MGKMFFSKGGCRTLFAAAAGFVLLSAHGAPAPKQPVKDEPAAKYWDFEKLKNPPVYRDDADPECAWPSLRAIVYDGVMENGKQTKCFAYIGFPEGPAPQGGFPAVVLAHGGGGTAYAWAADMWRAAGYAVIAPDWYGRRPVRNDAYWGKRRDKDRPFAAHKRPYEYHTVTNVSNLVLAHSLLLSLPRVNKDKTAYVGLSWGSWFGAMVAAVDPRFKGIVEIYLGNKMKYADSRMIDGRFLHEAKSPVYYIVSTNERYGDPDSMQAAFDACGKMLGNKSMVVRLPHSHIGFHFKWLFRTVDAILKGGPGLPKLGKPVVSGKTISAPVLDPGKGIRKVLFCWTAQSERAKEKSWERKWETAPAELAGGTVKASLPDGVWQCYLAAYDEDDLRSHCCGSSDVVTFPEK